MFYTVLLLKFLINSTSVSESFNYALNKMYTIVNNPKFKEDRPTVIYIHGWLQDGKTEEGSMAIKGAYRDRGDHNIVVVDWSAYSKLELFQTPYVTPIKNLKIVSETLNKLLIC